MASVRTPQEALDFAKKYVGNAAIDNTTLDQRILNNAADKLWMFAPWSWTIAQAPDSTLVEDQEDYTIVDPTDVLHLVRAEITKSSQNNQIVPLEIVHTLASQTATKGQPRRISAVNGTTLRLWPVPSGLATGDTGKLMVWYKKCRPEIVRSGATGTQVNYTDEAALTQPDEWFWVYQELVLYYAMKYANDSRTGSVALSAGGGGQETRYSGQLAEALDAMTQMARKEKLFLNSDGTPVNG